MKEMAAFGKPELVVTPVAVSALASTECELVAEDPRVIELDVSVVMCGEEADTQGDDSVLGSRSGCGLLEAHLIEPRIVRTAVIMEVVVVPVR
jgi:hypothetical protein